MAKKPVEVKPVVTKAEDSFVELMVVAADFVKACGGLEQAKKSLDDAGQFITRAGGVVAASKALGVLENLKSKI